MIFDRKTKIIYEEKIFGKKELNFLYKNKFGRYILKNLVIKKTFSKLSSFYYNSFLSRRKILSFINEYNIDLNTYIRKNYKSFNDFFIRKMKREYLIDKSLKNQLISPCDGKLTIYKINEKSKILVKNNSYTMEDICNDKYLAKDYKDGLALVFRLTVDDYHRYCYFDNGLSLKNKKIEGVLHTVGDISSKDFKIYELNSREYELLKTEHFGEVIYMEVGALLVGKINNNKISQFERAEEKGYFSFGGSTIVLFFKKDCINIDKDILENSYKGIETKVNILEKIGEKYKCN